MAELHSQLLQATIFRDFVEFKGRDHFCNVGFTHFFYMLHHAHHFRSPTGSRPAGTSLPAEPEKDPLTSCSWLLQCNPQLAALVTHTLGSDHWLVESKLLAQLLPMAENAKFREAFKAIKQDNKRRVSGFIACKVSLTRGRKLADVLESELGITVNINSIFAAQIKRLHEVNLADCVDVDLLTWLSQYKRQTLNIFSIIHRYLTIKKASAAEKKKMQPWTYIFAGKAAPGASLWLNASASLISIRLLHRKAGHSTDRQRWQGGGEPDSRAISPVVADLKMPEQRS